MVKQRMFLFLCLGDGSAGAVIHRLIFWQTTQGIISIEVFVGVLHYRLHERQQFITLGTQALDLGSGIYYFLSVSIVLFRKVAQPLDLGKLLKDRFFRIAHSSGTRITHGSLP